MVVLGLDATASVAVAMVADIQADAKLSTQLTKKFAELYKESSICIVSFDEDKKKIGVFTMCSKAQQAAGLDAKNWCMASMEAAGGGKGGGKPASGMGFVVDADASQIPAVLTAARAFAESKGITVN
jgi:alanyl-tRNA synthetase